MLNVPPPPISRRTKARFYTLFAFRHWFANASTKRNVTPDPPLDTQRPSWLQRREQRVLAQIQKESKLRASGLVEEIPHISPEGLTHEAFKQYHKSHTPVVIDGFMKSTMAVKTWTLPWFRDNYGHEPVRLAIMRKDVSQPGNDAGLQTSFGAGLDQMLAGERVYMFGHADILAKNPELIQEYLDIPRLSRLCDAKFVLRNKKNEVDPFSSTLFVGGPRSGTSLHCAGGTNMFALIHGSKTWTLIPPVYTPYVYPQMDNKGLYCHSPLDLKMTSDELFSLGYELWKYVPRYEAHLEPGDVLFNPAWWWHWVENTSETTLAVATRFLSDRLFAGNPVLQALLISHWHTFQLFIQWKLFGKEHSDAQSVRHIFPDEHAEDA